MAIERTEPMVFHKSFLMKALEAHPEDVHKMFPGEFQTAQEAIDYLRQMNQEWLVGGEFLTDAELKERRKENP